MTKKLALMLVGAAMLMISAAFFVRAEDKAPQQDVRVLLKTNKGDITLQLYASKTPVTAASFLNLAKRGYYNGVTFHRVIDNFMVQTGDPTATGAGTPGYAFRDEFVEGLKHDGPGVLSMANIGKPGTNGSQFFITHRATPHLNNKHTVFGKVLKGQNVVDSIVQGDRIETVEFLDSPDEILKAEASSVKQWNEVLDQHGGKAVIPGMPPQTGSQFRR